MSTLVPFDAVPQDSLRSLVEAFILREGTDYGEQEVSTAQKVDEVIMALKSGTATIIFSEVDESFDIVNIDSLQMSASTD